MPTELKPTYDKAVLRELLERVEGASGPDRGLDRAMSDDSMPKPRVNPAKDRALTLAVEATARYPNSAPSIIQIARIFEKYLAEDSNAV